MTDKLPPNLLALFAPRPPLRFLPPSDHPSGERKTREISGIAQFLPALKEYIETDDHKPTESWLQRHDRKKLEKKERQEKLLKDGPTSCEGYPLCPEYLLSSLSDFWALVSRHFYTYADYFLLQTNHKRIQIFVAMLSRHLLLHD